MEGNRPGVSGPAAPLPSRPRNALSCRARTQGGMMTLRTAIDKDFFYIENISYTDNDLKAMPYDELETLRMLIQKKIDGLSLSLKDKQEDNFNGGKKRSLYLNKRVLEYVNSLMRKQREKKKQLADYFFEHARAILPPILFEQILNDAQASVKAGSNE
jgi:hypothetical protein